MNAETRQGVVDALDHCRKARERLGANGAHRTRVLLDMTVLALSRELALLGDAKPAPGSAAVGTTG